MLSLALHWSGHSMHGFIFPKESCVLGQYLFPIALDNLLGITEQIVMPTDHDSFL